MEELWSHHPRWEALRDKLENGIEFPLIDLSEQERLKDLAAAKERGNHKSAATHEKFLADAMKKEVAKGWNLVLPVEEILNIPNLQLSPMGVADAVGISATGEFVPKLRVTHDLSFPGEVSGQSVNSRVIKDDLEPCMFGHALLRIVHHIVNLRRKYPNKIIWIRKDDFKSAYRRFHLRASTAIKSAVVIKMNTVKYLLISLRMPFGGSPCPSDFSLAADIITDTINDLMICREWDPKIVHSQYIRQVPEKIALGNEVQFASARAMSVSIPDEEVLKADVFIDDIISVAPDIGDNLQRVVAAPCTVLHTVSH